MLTIRPARKSEWPVVADVTVRAYEEYSTTMDATFWMNYERSIRETITTELGLCRFIAVENENLVGSVIYFPPYERKMGGKLVRNRYPEMRLLSVLPEHRNKGIAQKLIDACENYAKSNGSETITLHTTNLMAVAKAMYERRGYQRHPEIDFEPAPGFTVFGYIKSLQADQRCVAAQ